MLYSMNLEKYFIKKAFSKISFTSILFKNLFYVCIKISLMDKLIPTAPDKKCQMPGFVTLILDYMNKYLLFHLFLNLPLVVIVIGCYDLLLGIIIIITRWVFLVVSFYMYNWLYYYN